MAEEPMTDAKQAMPSGQLSAVVTADEGTRVVTLAGEIDYDTGNTLREALDISGMHHPRVVVDMHQATFIDSSGINILIAAHHTISKAGGWLRLAAPTTTVMRTLSLVGVDAFIDCRDTLTQALGD
ncbi:STAS domain-containing protein [Streptomyces lavendulocolor]|uniref:STAS domain-containing protein n=1 Tax=Streptomyces lavendulocolor TaxID=67316 RepID=UPI003C2CD613